MNPQPTEADLTYGVGKLLFAAAARRGSKPRHDERKATCPLTLRAWPNTYLTTPCRRANLRQLCALAALAGPPLAMSLKLISIAAVCHQSSNFQRAIRWAINKWYYITVSSFRKLALSVIFKLCCHSTLLIIHLRAHFVNWLVAMQHQFVNCQRSIVSRPRGQSTGILYQTLANKLTKT